MTIERHDTVATALARILAIVDLTDVSSIPPALAEAIEKARTALAGRDNNRCVLILGETLTDAGRWAARYEQDGGAPCHPIHDGNDLTLYTPPLTVVILPDADNRDDWPQLRAQIAALGPLADTIRIPNA